MIIVLHRNPVCSVIFMIYCHDFSYKMSWDLLCWIESQSHELDIDALVQDCSNSSALAMELL